MRFNPESKFGLPVASLNYILLCIVMIIPQFFSTTSRILFYDYVAGCRYIRLIMYDSIIRMLSEKLL